MSPKTTALAPVEVSHVPAPMFGAAALEKGLEAYQQIQAMLDRKMADQVMTIEGRKFRKKGYWRGVAIAFNLTLELVEERREVLGTFEDGHDNFVCFVIYRATAPNGRSAVGDGSCAAIEKVSRRETNKWRALPWQATEHNVRSHAHTRAFNRAVSGLVGFGEVSAEELEREDDGDPGPARGEVVDPRPAAPAVARPPAPRRVAPESKPITEPQQRKLFATAKDHGWTDTQQLKNMLYLAFGITSTKDLRMADFEQALALVERGPGPAAATGPAPAEGEP